MGDVTVEGYTVPGNSLAIANLTEFMRDSRYWDDHDQFRPERFLSRTADGDWKLVKKEQFVPYGLGRRVCMGESLARDTLLSFLNPRGHSNPDPANFTDGFTVIPHPFYVN